MSVLSLILLMKMMSLMVPSNFRAPAKILKDHGSPAYFHVSVWEAGRLLNSSVLAPVSGHDYKIVIDKLRFGI